MAGVDGKIVIVTGAAQGIGAAYAQSLASSGAKVCVADILDPEQVVAAVTAAGGEAIGCVTDVSDLAACEKMVADTIRAFGGLDAMVSNAAVFATLDRISFLDIDAAQWDRVMAVNVRGVFNCARAAAPAMKVRGGGSIINISSDTVMKGVPLMLHYVSSKGAVLAMTRALARELGDDNIRVNAVAPGLTMSEGIEAKREMLGVNIEFSIASAALKREQVPEDLVGVVRFLVSDDSAFITGQTLVVNGGAVMH
ncbi:MAG: SDR family NAD(P)-dependent oxidoreductase [Alphaproteobacteria bacterium]